jgi:GrpB-like predicted nucleotidyltransferase (UPF0157 family)
LEKDLQQRIEEATREEISIVPYDPQWPDSFETEAQFLRGTLPQSLIGRIEHFGSTAVLGLSAKPIIDILIEVAGLRETQKHIVPILTSKGYDYFWRTDIQPPYAWFIKRDSAGRRTHHLHFVEADSKLWDRLLFRDYLRQFPDAAKRYSELKVTLAKKFPNNRVAYTEGKAPFILELTEKASQYFASSRAHPSDGR